MTGKERPKADGQSERVRIALTIRYRSFKRFIPLGTSSPSFFEYSSKQLRK